MRLIDADLLEPDADYDDGEFWAYSTTQIKNAPTIEPEQRWIPCGKCIHADGKHRWCKVLDRSINEDYFCCWAEPYRKEGEAE